jgi:hypothetical protein
MKETLLASLGMMSSLKNSLRPSAIGCSSPCQPLHPGGVGDDQQYHNEDHKNLHQHCDEEPQRLVRQAQHFHDNPLP